MKWDAETEKVRNEYKKKFGLNPPGINYDEYDTTEDYRNHLKVLIKEGKIE